MAKIDQIIVSPNSGFDTGETAKNKINEAMRTAEVDSTLLGNGTISDPLRVNSGITVQQSALTLNVTDIDIDFNSKNNFESIGAILQITATSYVNLVNDANSRECRFLLDIVNKAPVVFPSYFLMQQFEVDAVRWNPANLTFTPLIDGLYEFTFVEYNGDFVMAVSDKLV